MTISALFSFSPEKDFARIQTNDRLKRALRKVEISLFVIGVLAIFATVLAFSQTGGVSTLSLTQNITLIGLVVGAGAAPVTIGILMIRLVRFYFSSQNRKLHAGFDGLHLIDALLGSFVLEANSNDKGKFKQLFTHMTHAQWSDFVSAIDTEFKQKKTLTNEKKAFLRFVGGYSDHLAHNLFYLSPQTIAHLRSSMEEKDKKHFDFLIEGHFEALCRTYGKMEAEPIVAEEQLNDPWLNYLVALSISFGGMPRETRSEELTAKQIHSLTDLCNRGLENLFSSNSNILSAQ